MSRKRSWLTSWVPHRLELLVSPSWDLAPVPLRRMLDRLEIEHLRHGGMNNGELFVSFRQFQDAGISRRKIASTVALGADLGLLERIRPDDHKGDLRAPNAYRLTYVPAKGKAAPSDEWKKVTKERALSSVEDFHASERKQVKDRQQRRAA